MRRYICICPALFLVSFSFLLAASQATAADSVPLKVLILDGQNNHDWKTTSPILKSYFQQCDRFDVEVATSPPERHDMSSFRPKFADYDVVVSNYNGNAWPKQTQLDFQAYVHNGGGFVAVHAADNSFPDWPEYNQMIGLGGWEGRAQHSGPYVYFRDGAPVRDDTKGRGGSHGSQHEFLVTTRDANHPIMQGLPTSWLHTKDELYDRLRGPAKNMQILATAYADPKQRGSGREEPMLMVIKYGSGRVFHTTLGHADYSMRCVGFITTLLRGSEWAATGKVTLALPTDFPTAKKSSSQK
ncbi:MAG: ThuA domain-containing protein [Planctomycetes bacterium]|nr:ThuA domain-containing protein [Planctomycetota bacterium]